jgi:hypothetical protein
MYQRLGVIKPYPDQADQGRFQLTKSEADKWCSSSVPRNTEKTGPYSNMGSRHDRGRCRRMSEYQFAEAAPEQNQSIVTWLKSLTARSRPTTSSPRSFRKATRRPLSGDGRVGLRCMGKKTNIVLSSWRWCSWCAVLSAHAAQSAVGSGVVF